MWPQPNVSTRHWKLGKLQKRRRRAEPPACLQWHQRASLTLIALALSGCAQSQKTPIVTDYACQGFQPYGRSAEHLDDDDRRWIAGHNAFGRSYCGETWEPLK